MALAQTDEDWGHVYRAIARAGEHELAGLPVWQADESVQPHPILRP